jgi:murein DD-endopeptidase MepM/ murein hydrolase activator NlpD
VLIKTIGMSRPFAGAHLVTQGFAARSEFEPWSYKERGRGSIWYRPVRDGQYDRWHNGIDYAMPVGTQLLSPAAGLAHYVGFDLRGYGLHLVLHHGSNVYSLFGHLAVVRVPVGARVARGDVVALSGGAAGNINSGNSSGPHLHFAVLDYPLAHYVNPARFFARGK